MIAGYQGVNPQTKEVTTLGGGGSDLSAAALAVFLKTDKCQIYTDVPGVMTANPNIEPRAKTIKFLEAKQMSSLSWLYLPRFCTIEPFTLLEKMGLPLKYFIAMLAMKNSYYKV